MGFAIFLILGDVPKLVGTRRPDTVSGYQGIGNQIDQTDEKDVFALSFLFSALNPMLLAGSGRDRPMDLPPLNSNRPPYPGDWKARIKKVFGTPPLPA